MLEFTTNEKNKNKYVINDITIYYLGNVKMFEYIKNNYKNIKFTGCTFRYAAFNGNLDNIKWLKENKCPWNENTFTYAAGNGNLENMKWLKENGCPP